MNKELIKQVQAGTHCVKHTRKAEDLGRLNRLLKFIYGGGQSADGLDGYYANSKRSGNRTWMWYRTLPSGLTPIPLDDFFKEEEKCICDGWPELQCLAHASPEQPTLPEVEGLCKRFDVHIGLTPDNELCIAKKTQAGIANLLINDDNSACFSFIDYKKQEGDIFQTFDAIQQDAFNALQRLVRLKDYKDDHGKDAYYEKEQPDAWAEAKAIIAHKTMGISNTKSINNGK